MARIRLLDGATDRRLVFGDTAFPTRTFVTTPPRCPRSYTGELPLQPILFSVPEYAICGSMLAEWHSLGIPQKLPARS
jgi:hypothetical protein